MASTFSTNLAIELIGTGDQAGTWGTTTNSNLGTLIEQAISGYVTQAVATGTDTTITIPNGSTGVARNMYIELTGTGGTNTNLIVPANKKLYFIFNNSTGAVTVKVSGQTGVSVPTGKKMVLVSNGTDIVNGLNYIADFGTNSFSVTNLTASSATITNLIATSASITNLALTSLTISSLSITNVSVASATVSSNLTLSGGTANGVLYLNGSKVATSGSALTYNGSNLINTNGYVSTSGDFRLNNATFSRVAIGDGGGGFVGGYNITYSGSPIYDSTGAISGVYYSSSGNVQFFAGGSAAAGTAAPEAMRLTASGNLGIGTSSPASKLHVDSDATNTTVTIESDLDGGSLFTSGINLLREGTVAGSRIQSIRDAGAGGVGLNFLTTADNAAEIAGTLTSRMVIDRSGNVGIGTASPGVKFHVANDGAGEADVARFSRTNAGDLHLLDIGVNPDTNFVTFDSTGSAAGGYTFRRGGTDAMTLDSSGNLGIGTSSPGAKLEVTGNILQTWAASHNRFIGTQFSTTYENGLRFLEATRETQVIAKAADTGGLITFFTGTTPSERMRLDASGNLGLGVTPSASWFASSKAIQIGSAGAPYMGLVQQTTTTCDGYMLWGARLSGDRAFQYVTTGDAPAAYRQNAGSHAWFSAASGTAGNAISFTQAMTLTAAGKLGIGVTSPSGLLDVRGAAPFMYIVDSAGANQAAFVAEATNTVVNVGSTYLGTAAVPLALVTGGTERARITSGGDLLVGTTSSGGAGGATIVPLGGGAGTCAIQIFNKTNTASDSAILFRVAGTTVSGISYTNTTVTYGTVSDYRLKNVIGVINDSGTRIDALKPIEYTWNSNGERARGFLAHQFQEVYASSVNGTKDAVDAEGKPAYQSMQASTSEVIADLVAEIQSLRARVAQLETK